MFNFGAFAGGLAQGMRSGQDMALRQEQATRARERLQAANDEIISGWAKAGADRPLPEFSTGSARIGHGMRSVTRSVPEGIDEGERGGPFRSAREAASSSHREGLGDAHKAPGITESRAPVTMEADEAIARRLLTGNLLGDPEEMTRMAGIYRKHGLSAAMTPWLNEAWGAGKMHIPEALGMLLARDAKGARAALKAGGIELRETPFPLDPDDMTGKWKFSFADGSERSIDLRQLARRFFPSSILLG
ncbi:hypothetical protein [Nitrosovibrio sp. Nv17]|uniref:hypothetical protein n=1 Tax=Nitrosovibrio sp. Nv17 TaxID=1855339 RepID=UPI000908F3A1|nr:hypothetical protein [Nitrosovibrio sp. Nv17]SFW21893.1 hypothetical protein SAMN05216414_106120 [Nitrosovibrio sp. Nv17]